MCLKYNVLVVQNWDAKFALCFTIYRAGQGGDQSLAYRLWQTKRDTKTTLRVVVLIRSSGRCHTYLFIIIIVFVILSLQQNRTEQCDQKPDPLISSFTCLVWSAYSTEYRHSCITPQLNEARFRVFHPPPHFCSALAPLQN